MRKLISIAIALVLIVGAIFVAKSLIANKKKPKPRANKIVKTVFTEAVKNFDVPIEITGNGNLVAKHKIELFSEVQGVLRQTSKEFKSGTKYRKGETIISINSEEFYASYQAQKSNLYNLLTSIMPDIQLDYPDEYNKWRAYLDNFDLNKSLKPLPNFTTDKEKFFITGRNILTNYYNVKNLEVKLAKYRISAPYNGILTEALVTPGTLVRQGQKLGEFINLNVYEVAVSVKSEYIDLLQVGKKVNLQNLDKTKTWKGEVIRINGKVDASTQTVMAFIQVKGEQLREGQYVEVVLQAKSETNAYEISRNLLVDGSNIYQVKDSILSLINIKPVYEKSNSIVIKGIEDGTVILSKPVPGAYDGMLVKISEEK